MIVDPLPLFDFERKYPNVPGAKARDTSFTAAEDMAPKAPTLRARCLAVIRETPRTADEVAAALRLGPTGMLTIRPRISELSELGEIEDSGRRRANASGKQAIVWKVKA